MEKYTTTILTVFFASQLFGQNANELNQKAKDLLNKNDIKNAVPLIRQAAEGGSAEAQYNYGICYQKGIEVPQSDSIANIWFLKSANQGWKDSQFKIAYSYANGRGFKQDYAQAFQWTLKCAAQNDPECMSNVIGCYMNGSGTVKNIDSMISWAIRLALLNNPEDLAMSAHITSARANLATMYRDGAYVNKDLVKSYMWFLIYNESKHDYSILVQQQNIEAIQSLDNLMSAMEKRKAVNDAEKLLQHKLSNLDNLYKQDL
jgi:uncharacterized protein